jgi:hypothetical protein
MSSSGAFAVKIAFVGIYWYDNRWRKQSALPTVNIIIIGLINILCMRLRDQERTETAWIRGNVFLPKLNDTETFDKIWNTSFMGYYIRQAVTR